MLNDMVLKAKEQLCKIIILVISLVPFNRKGVVIEHLNVIKMDRHCLRLLQQTTVARSHKQIMSKAVARVR